MRPLLVTGPTSWSGAARISSFLQTLGSRWTGIVDGPTFERFANAWQLLDGTDGRAPAGFYVFVGLNWESDGESPIVCVTLKVFGLESAAAEVGRPSAGT